MVFEKNFLRLTVTVRLQKNEHSKNVDFLILFLSKQSYKNVTETKQIYFSPTFLKSWVCTSWYEAHGTNKRDIG